MKQKFDIYINVEMRKKFIKEPNKSGLINALLLAFYTMPKQYRDEIRSNLGNRGRKSTIDAVKRD